MTAPIRLGTRSSALAMWQARRIGERLAEFGRPSEIVTIETEGDLDKSTPLGAGMGQGVFVKTIEQALTSGRIDMAVHSAKDLPTALTAGTELGAIPERANPFDALVTRGGAKFEDLPKGARLATGSLRRAAQALALRPDLKIVPIRGNVPTRLGKVLEANEADALLAGMAGLIRLELTQNVAETLDAERMTPQMGQGALALQVREGELGGVMDRLRHASHDPAVRAERAFIERLGGSCTTPAGVYALRTTRGIWELTGFIASPGGEEIMRHKVEIAETVALSKAAVVLAETLLGAAPAELLEAAKLRRGLKRDGW